MRGTLIWSLTGVAVAGLLLSPMLLTMVRHAPAHLNASVGYSADLANLIVPTRVTAVGGAWGSSVANHLPGNLAEQGPYLGLPLLVIVASFASSRRSGPGARLLLFVLLSSIVLSLGPRLTVGGRPTAWLPAALLGHLPALADALPVRFALYTSLVISIIVAVWLAGARRQRALSWVFAGLAVLSIAPSTARTLWWRPTPSAITSGKLDRLLPAHSNVLSPEFRS